MREALQREPTQKEAGQRLALRRGWYLGSEDSRDRLMERAGRVLAGRKRASYDRQGSLHKHDQARGAELLAEALARLSLSLPEAKALPHSDAAKQALAWFVKSQTIVPDEWLVAQLRMGHRSNVSRAVRAYGVASDQKRRQLFRLLHTP